MKTEVFKHSRLARTPPSTFLFLHLHLSNSPGSENPSPIAGSFVNPHSTANDNRLLSAVDSLILVRSFTGTKTCLGLGPRQRRAQWPGYKPARSALSTVLVNNRHVAEQILAAGEVVDIKRLCAVLEPQSCDVLALR